MLAQVDERRNPRSSATLDQLLDRYLPGMRALASEHGLSISTVKRAFSLLQEWGIVSHVDGERARVLPQPRTAELAHAVPEPFKDAESAQVEPAPVGVRTPR